MPREEENAHIESTPHFDGANEGIMNDTLATQGSQMGITVEPTRELVQKKNPFPIHFKPDEGMQEFDQLMRGE